MPPSDEARQPLLHADEEAQRRAEEERRAEDHRHFFQKAWQGFAAFALRENVLEVALGLIIAKAFSRVVSSLVSDVLLPVVSLLPFLNHNFHDMFAVPKGGAHQKEGYNTIEQALSDGALVLAYGTFLENILNFFGIGLSLYLIAQIYGFFSKDSMIKHMKQCQYCKKPMSEAADRCANCTSWVGERK